VRSRGSGSSGPPLANFTTLVGPRSSIQRLQRVWFGLIGLRGVLVDGALPPRFLDAGGPGEERTTVASVRHRPGVPGR